ncbi:pseudouridine synthase [Tautonia plasticadhaerens]|uniref:Pseudouridine synthase n=1 Tax=Tautonia plasticadhaerens TaxID=2527974 RepID=A0A518GWX7_9BACT|nr:pseudouridine synthase [Tautonia plasticadhaerens]QDV33062.1 Ribosomal large subunit pseudouridine synthase B [Tautonia plasticadhaerens]
MAQRPPRRGGGPPPRRAGSDGPRPFQGGTPGGRPRSGGPPRPFQSNAGGPKPAGRPGTGPRRPHAPGRPALPRSPEQAGAERLNKILAAAGHGSRRAVEELILQGRVTVDGQVVRDLATKVDPNRVAITVDGERVRQEKVVYVAVYKPKGFISSNADPAGRPRVIDLVPDLPQRVYPIGRLDEDSTGLILLTNDGELANRLAHPRYGVEKVYRVLVAGKPGPEVLDKLVEGVWLSEGKARARDARFVNEKSHHGEATMIELTLAEGKNREVRRMLAKLGHKVMRLTRIAVGPVTLKGLAAGQWRHLDPEEVSLLRRAADGESLSSRRQDRREPTPRRSRGRDASGPAPAGPRSGMGHLVGGADAPRGRRPAGPRFGRDQGPPQGQGGRRPGGAPGRGPVGASSPPPVGPAGRRPPRRPVDDGADEVLVPPISPVGRDGGDGPPPPAGRARRPAGLPTGPTPGGPPRRPAGRPRAGGGPGNGNGGGPGGRGRGPSGPGGPPRRKSAGAGGGPALQGGGPPPPGGRGRRPSRGGPVPKPPGPVIKRRPKPLPKSRRSKRSDDE